MGRGVLFMMSAEYSVVMCEAWTGTYSDLTVATSRYDILLCCETLASDMRHVSGVAGCLIWSPCLVMPGQDTSGLSDGGIRMRWIRSISPT